MRTPWRESRYGQVVAVALAAAMVGGLLAVAGYQWIRNERLDASRRQSVAEADVYLDLFTDDLDADEVVDLLRRIATEDRVEVFASLESGTVASDRGLSSAIIDDIGMPSVDRTRSGEVTASAFGRRWIVVGGRAPRDDTSVYFLFDQMDVEQGLALLRPKVWAAWGLSVALAAVLGWITVQHDLRRVAVARDREHRFTADVAHELRTPLGSMVTAVSLLEQRLDGLEPDIRAPVHVLVAETRRMDRLVDHLLELARLETGGIEQRLERLRVVAVVDAAASRLPNSSAVDVDVVDDVVVEADRTSMSRILTNLLRNAVEHGGEPVQVRIRQDGDEAQVEVVDHGPGLPPDEMDDVFDRFHTGDRSRSGGTGLGLSIAHEHAELMGGSLEAGNHDDGGAVFTLRLPCADRLDPRTT